MVLCPFCFESVYHNDTKHKKVGKIFKKGVDKSKRIWYNTFITDITQYHQ